MDRIAVVPDIHLRDECETVVIDNLKTCVNQINEKNPDHLFVPGDMIEESSSKTKDLEHLEKVSNILRSKNFPVTFLLGNHDVMNLSKLEIKETLRQPRFYGVKEFEETTVFYMDSTSETVNDARGILGQEQKTWLQEQTDKYENILLFNHHPLGNFNISDNVWFRDYPERAFLWDRKTH